MSLYYNINAQRQTGSIFVFTIPSRAKIFIDCIEQKDSSGNPILTPARIDNITSGIHTCILSHSGYVDSVEIMNIGEEDTHSIFRTMQTTPAELREIFTYSFIASFSAGTLLYLLTRDRKRRFT